MLLFLMAAGGICANYAICNDLISPDALYWTSSGDILIIGIIFISRVIFFPRGIWETLA